MREDDFERMGEEQAYWLGFIQGDGCVNRKSLVVALERSDEDHLVRLRKAIGSTQPISRTVRKAGYGKGCESSRLQLCSKKLVASLRARGVGRNKTFDSAFPHFLPVDLRRHWLRGLFDADSSVSRLSRKLSLVFMVGGYAPVMRECRAHLVREIGAGAVKISKCKEVSDRYGKLQYGGVNTLRDIYTHLYRDATVWLPRKREVFERFFRDREAIRGEAFVPAGIHVPIEVLANQMGLAMF